VDGNTGLWYDKFCDQWRREGASWTMKASQEDKSAPSGKQQWLADICGECGERGLLAEAELRMLRMVHMRDGRFGVFKSESRFVTGLGRSHPVENGFAWHPTLGTPYLAGSSIKGMVRAWAVEEGVDAEQVDRLLGEGGEKGSVGALIFLDALPRRPVRLEVDVLTRHYAGWTPDSPPGDWLSPVPVPFLVVAAGAEFLFGIQPRYGVTVEDIERAWKWLKDALLWAGAGAKTAVGYGRFEYFNDRTSSCEEVLERERRARRQKELLVTPGGKWRAEVEACESEHAVLDLVLRNLEKLPIEDPLERAAFIAAVEETGYVDWWRQGKAKTSTSLGKKKIKQRYRLLRL